MGGATYHGWPNLKPAAIASFVKTFGLDGVDVDYEEQPVCTKDAGGESASLHEVSVGCCWVHV